MGLLAPNSDGAQKLLPGRHFLFHRKRVSFEIVIRVPSNSGLKEHSTVNLIIPLGYWVFSLRKMSISRSEKLYSSYLP